MDIIVGTAGHIDHGKTALVKALTGTDADRLPEEKKRGITIDLGFAQLNLGDVKFGFVDVPGHEKFVKNMLAGASGIDLVLLVIAADEGVMPQTREHFEICRLLETGRGVIVLTKSDLADKELIELVKLDAAELVKDSFLQNAPMIPVSSKTGAGLEELKKILVETASKISERKDEKVARLPIDRVFSIKGFGAVVTGTLASGEIKRGEELELLPAGKKVRVRGVQNHGKDVEIAYAGQRTAVNLGGIEQNEIERGIILADSNTLRPSQVIDAEIEVLKDSKKAIRSRQRIRVHIGTVEAFARVEVLNDLKKIAPGEKDFVQLRFEKPIVSLPGERFILRQYSPQETIAGGFSLDSIAEKHRGKEINEHLEFLEKLKKAIKSNDKTTHVRLLLEKAKDRGMRLEDLQAQTGFKKEVLQNAIEENLSEEKIVKCESFLVAENAFGILKTRIIDEIAKHHEKEPLARGILRETLREKTAGKTPPEVFGRLISALIDEERIVAENDIIKSFEHKLDLSEREEKLKQEIFEAYKKAGLQVKSLKQALRESAEKCGVSEEKARKVFQLLVDSGDLLKINEEFYFARGVIEDLISKIKNFALAEAENRLMGVSEFKRIAGVSRKYAIPLLEYFDGEKITKRAGNKRLIL